MKDILICFLGIELRALLKHIYSMNMKVVHEGREVVEETFDGSRRRWLVRKSKWDTESSKISFLTLVVLLQIFEKLE